MNDNPLLQGSSRTVNSRPKFSGHAYSGLFSESGVNPNTEITIGSSENNEPTVYGSLADMILLNIYDRFIQNGAINKSVVCRPNDALTFAGGEPNAP